MFELRERVLAASLIAMVLAACAAIPRATGEHKEVHRLIDQAWGEHIEAAVRKDESAVMDIYAADIDYAVPGIQHARGADAMRAIEVSTLRNNDLAWANHHVEDLRVFDDLAYELGTVVGRIRPNGGEEVLVTYHFMAMWQRGADGAWRIRSMAGLPE